MSLPLPDLGPATGTRFALGEDVFAAHATADGQAHVWAAGPMRVGHDYSERALWPAPPGADPSAWTDGMTARRHYWAAVAGIRLGKRHRQLVEAMRAAIAERDRRRWAPKAEPENESGRPASVAA